MIPILSDEDILYKIGKYKFNANQTIRSSGSNVLQNIIKKYNIDKDDPRPGLIRWAESVTPRILPDNEEIIRRVYWDLDSLNGETEKQLLHLDYWTIGQYILQNHKRKHDILTIFECSTAKPYASNKVLKSNYLDKYGLFTDFACISNPGIIPLEYSQFYPYRFDEWDHGAEKNDIAKKYRIVNKYRFINYVKKLGYKHVIVLMQNPYTQLCINDAFDENINNCKDWLHIVTNDEFWKEAKLRYLPHFNNNMGLLIQRLLLQTYTRECYRSVLRDCLNDSDKVIFDELIKLMDNINPKSKKDREKIKDFNIQHGWEPLDYLHGIKNVSVKRMTSKNAVDSNKVNKYKTFIKNEIKYLIENYNPHIKKYHESGVYNTVLDWVLKYFNGSYIEDPDTEYWNMKAALDEVDELECFCEYCYYIKYIYDKFSLSKENLEYEANKLKIIQLNLKHKQADFNKIKKYI